MSLLNPTSYQDAHDFDCVHVHEHAIEWHERAPTRSRLQLRVGAPVT